VQASDVNKATRPRPRPEHVRPRPRTLSCVQGQAKASPLQGQGQGQTVIRSRPSQFTVLSKALTMQIIVRYTNVQDLIMESYFCTDLHHYYKYRTTRIQVIVHGNLQSMPHKAKTKEGQGTAKAVQAKAKAKA